MWVDRYVLYRLHPGPSSQQTASARPPTVETNQPVPLLAKPCIYPRKKEKKEKGNGRPSSVADGERWLGREISSITHECRNIREEKRRKKTTKRKHNLFRKDRRARINSLSTSNACDCLLPFQNIPQVPSWIRFSQHQHFRYR